MCNLFLSLRPRIPRLRLVLLSIRDEQLQRPTAAAAWREGVLSAIDLQDPLRGTWFGINEQGKIGILLSITQLQKDKRIDVPSREYNGFTFVAIDRPNGDYQMHSFTNTLVDVSKTLSWSEDVSAIGNCPPHKTYGKLERGKGLFEKVLDDIEDSAPDSEIAESLFSVGMDTTQCYPDAQLDSQVDKYDPRSFSSIFLRVGSPPVYGTRSQTALIVSADGSSFLRERRLISINENGSEDWETQDFSFLLPPTTSVA